MSSTPQETMRRTMDPVNAGTPDAREGIVTDILDSVAALRLLSVTDRPKGYSVEVAGYATPGDGGDHDRMLVYGSAGSWVDNNNSVIVPTGGDGSRAWVTYGHHMAPQGLFGYSLYAGLESGNFVMTDGGIPSYGGAYNTGFGTGTLKANTTGSFVTAMGANAARFNTTGEAGTHVGAGAGNKNTIGNHNTNIGAESGYTITSGIDNTNVGVAANGTSSVSGLVNIGTANSVFGANAMSFNESGNSNTVGGQSAANALVSGSYNAIWGQAAAALSTTASYLAVLGQGALNGNTVGHSIVAIGQAAGLGDGTNVNNKSVVDTNLVIIGRYATRDESISNATVLTNSIVIGYGAKFSKSNQAVFGQPSITETVLRNVVKQTNITNGALRILNQVDYVASGGGTEAAAFAWNMSTLAEASGPKLGMGAIRTAGAGGGDVVVFNDANTDANPFDTSADNVHTRFRRDRSTMFSGWLEFPETTAPGAPPANGVRLFAVEGGSGKTDLYALFQTGAAVLICSEP